MKISLEIKQKNSCMNLSLDIEDEGLQTTITNTITSLIDTLQSHVFKSSQQGQPLCNLGTNHEKALFSTIIDCLPDYSSSCISTNDLLGNSRIIQALSSLPDVSICFPFDNSQCISLFNYLRMPEIQNEIVIFAIPQSVIEKLNDYANGPVIISFDPSYNIPPNQPILPSYFLMKKKFFRTPHVEIAAHDITRLKQSMQSFQQQPVRFSTLSALPESVKTSSLVTSDVSNKFLESPIGDLPLPPPECLGELLKLDQTVQSNMLKICAYAITLIVTTRKQTLSVIGQSENISSLLKYMSNKWTIKKILQLFPHLISFDNDRVELTNLGRQIYENFLQRTHNFGDVDVSALESDSASCRVAPPGFTLLGTHSSAQTKHDVSPQEVDSNNYTANNGIGNSTQIKPPLHSLSQIHETPQNDLMTSPSYTPQLQNQLGDTTTTFEPSSHVWGNSSWSTPYVPRPYGRSPAAPPEEINNLLDATSTWKPQQHSVTEQHELSLQGQWDHSYLNSYWPNYPRTNSNDEKINNDGNSNDIVIGPFFGKNHQPRVWGEQT